MVTKPGRPADNEKYWAVLALLLRGFKYKDIAHILRVSKSQVSKIRNDWPLLFWRRPPKRGRPSRYWDTRKRK